MKTKTSILTLTKAFFILIFSGCLFIACNNGTTKPVNMEDTYRGLVFQKMVVDSCEYIFLDSWFAHKGNCKYCKERSLNNR